MKKKILIGSILAVALLTLVSFSSVVGYNVVKNTQEEIITDEWDFEYCKNYLLETLVEISNNEDVRDLINSNNKESVSVEHLEFIYNMGLKMIDRLGENKVLEIIETTSIDKPDYANELYTIIMGNDELKERIYTLNEMNVKSDTLDWEFPIICGILNLILAVCLLIMSPVNFICEIFLYTGNMILAFLIAIIFSPISIIGLICLDLWFFVFTCIPDYPHNI
jgi:hypothetical protein